MGDMEEAQKTKMMKIEIPIYHDVWMDNGLENLYGILGDIEGVETSLEEDKLRFEITDKEKFFKGFQIAIESRMNSVIFVERIDKKTGERKNVKKDFVLSQYGKKVGGRNVLKEKIYSETEKRLKEIIENINEGDKVCILCGKSYLKNVDKLKQSVYPFVTKIRSLSGIRTIKGLKDYNDTLCPLCYLVGSLEWTDGNIIFRSFLGGGERRYSVVFLPLMSNLRDLDKFKKMYTTTLEPQDLISNIRTKTGYGEGESATLLYFYEKLFNEIWFQQELPEDLLDYSGVEKEICKDWVAIRVPSGAVKNIKYEKLKISSDILRTVYGLTKERKLIYSSFISKIFFILEKRNPEREREISQEIKEGVSRAFLRDDLNSFASYLLPRKGGHVVIPREAEDVLYGLIQLWRWYKMGLSDEELKTLKSTARIVAMIANKGHIGILYKLDRARNPDEFLSGLRELSRRLIGLKDEEGKKIYPPALETLVETLEKNKANKELFGDVKNVLVIFSCVEISKIKRAGGGKNE